MRRAATAFAAALVALSVAMPPPARADLTNAAVNGFARASAAYVPLLVNPNFDFWPVYSLSETDGSLSHGISAGFWPGFLVDATFFEFGYQPFERAFMGVAESAYPIQPAQDEAGTTDFANDCVAGGESSLPLPLGLGTGKAPEPLLTGCESLYTQYQKYIPWSVASARTESDNLTSDGSALGAQLHLGTITIGDAYSSTYTNAARGTRTESGATVILSDVNIEGTIHIGEIISTVRTVADGSVKGAVTDHSFTYLDATYNGQHVKIDDHGVSLPDGSSLNDALAKTGISLEIVPGEQKASATQAQASTGALVVEAAEQSSGDALGGTDARCRQLASLQPSPIATVQQTIAPNPLATNVPPYDQLPPNVSAGTTVPPPVPCPLQLMERSVDTGVALGGATAASRYQPLPAIPGFGNGGGTIDLGSGGPPFAGGGIATQHGSGGSLLPSFNAVPPVPIQALRTPAPLDQLGAAVAFKVKALYAGLALLLAALVAGRRIFRYLIRT